MLSSRFGSLFSEPSTGGNEGLFQLGFLARDLSLELTVRVALQVRLFESPGLSLPVLQLLARVRVTKGRMLTLVLGKHL